MAKEQREKLGVAETVPDWMGPWMREDIDFFYPDPTRYYEDCWEFATMIAPKYKTAIIDSISRMGDGILKQVARTPYEGVTKETKRMKIGTGPSATIHPIMSDYGFAQDRIREIITTLDEGTAHVLLVSHEKTSEIKEGDITKRVMAGPRSVGNALIEVIPSIVDIAVRVEGRRVPVKDAGGKYTGGFAHEVVMRTRNHDIYLAGDRSGLFQDEEPLDPRIFWEKLTKLIQMAGADGAQKEK
jgi:hypothetical protein